MDRRNYRGNMGRRQMNMNPYRPNDPVCSDLMNDYTPDDMCERDDFDRDSDRFPIGMCYVPWQRFKNLYENEFVALANGTLFKDLDLKWYGRGCK
ncbi:MAG: hypothetical protein K0R00_3908 [Herbinix sp.]|jgi:hypothetical protein|nr:hypothetical protein [Herbinix sp.]